MPKIDFSFSGWVSGADITTTTNAAGETVDVSQMDPDELANKLETQELMISLGDHLYSSRKSEFSLFDFEDGAG